MNTKLNIFSPSLFMLPFLYFKNELTRSKRNKTQASKQQQQRRWRKSAQNILCSSIVIVSLCRVSSVCVCVWPTVVFAFLISLPPSLRPGTSLSSPTLAFTFFFFFFFFSFLAVVLLSSQPLLLATQHKINSIAY